MHSIALDSHRSGLRPEADPDTGSGRPQNEQWSDLSKNPISQRLESNHGIKGICLRVVGALALSVALVSGGAVGGPWFIGTGSAGSQNSINSFGYNNVPNTMSGPYWGSVIQNAYDSASA